MRYELERYSIMLESFKFESVEQKKGFGAFIQFVRSQPYFDTRSNADILPLFILWSIQKDHESHIWWMETVGQQIKTLEDELARLKGLSK